MASAELNDDGTYIVVQTMWTEKDLIKQVPGVNWDAYAKTWKARLSWASCVALRGVFGANLQVGARLSEWSWEERRKRIDPTSALRGLIDLDAPDLDQRLLPFQRASVRFMQYGGDVLDAMPMGAGKTIETLATLNAWKNDQMLPALVVCPNSVKTHWANEINTWFPLAEPFIVKGSAKQRREVLLDAMTHPAPFVIINIEALLLHSRLAPYGSVRLLKCTDCGGTDPDLKTTRCEVHHKELNEIPFRTVIVDEAHRMKNAQAKQTRACWAVQHGPTVQTRWALTGTPLANHPGDLWSIMHGIAPQDYPVKTAYVDRYCLQTWDGRGGLAIVGVRPDTRDEFFAILNPRMRRVPKELILPQLPPKVRSVRFAEMTAKQAKTYRELEETMVALLPSGERIITTNNLALQTRLMQLSSSYCTVAEDGMLTLAEPCPKLDVMEEVLDELEGRQVVVCAESRQLIELAAARLEKRHDTYAMITGSVPEHVRAAGLRDFQENRLRCMLFTVKAGGVGLTMTAAGTIVRLQRSWSMLDNMQAEDRVHRIGSEHHDSIHVIDIVAPSTVEEDQVRALLVKAARLEEVVRDRAQLEAAGYSVEATIDQVTSEPLVRTEAPS
jgi:SNF2 family DNA or RNA helicase